MVLADSRNMILMILMDLLVFAILMILMDLLSFEVMLILVIL